MSMREIQDMTLNLSRGLERLKEKLSERSESFDEEFQKLATPQDAFGIRMTAAPIGDEIKFNTVYRQGGIVEELRQPVIEVQRKVGDATVSLSNVQTDYGLNPSDWRPRLRAAHADASLSIRDVVYGFLFYQVHCDGLLEISFLSKRYFKNPCSGNDEANNLQSESIVSMFAQVVEWADRIRKQAKNPMAEFVIEVEIKSKCGGVKVTFENNHRSGYLLGILPMGTYIFPHYSLSESAKKVDLVSQFERDFWNFLEKDIGDRQGYLEFH